MSAALSFSIQYGRFALMLVFLSLLLGCGYKGPLYLPAPPDTLSGQGTVIEDTPPPTFSDTQNPSLEPSPIVIE